MKPAVIVFASLLAALVFSGCSLTKVSGGEEIQITAGERSGGMYLEPSEITVTAGADVTFVIKNEGSQDHEFESYRDGEAGIDEIIIPPGATRRVSWTAPSEAATFPVYCDLPGHRAAGMEIALKVVPDTEER
ncbi:MAG: cupredoxin domain-containing protein [Dehalococcoidia bacterium]|nr:cupredoxin domain-containing protein [Dehalococcoidia bacterium]